MYIHRKPARRTDNYLRRRKTVVCQRNPSPEENTGGRRNISASRYTYFRESIKINQIKATHELKEAHPNATTKDSK